MKYLTLPLLFLLACANVKPSTNEANAEAEMTPPQSVPVLLVPTLEAHGGLAKWRSFGTLAFAVPFERQGGSEGKTEYLLDLPSRYERIIGPDYTLGFDGTNYWQVLQDGVEPQNPQFVINLQFYFFALPFVMADPGVRLERLAERSLQGKRYEVLKATFETGTGVADGDQYLLYLDPQSHRLEYLLYSVTFFDESRAENYNALHYAAWQAVEGLWVPQRLDGYKWDAENEQLGEKRYSRSFVDVSFREDRPPFSSFARPAEAFEE